MRYEIRVSGFFKKEYLISEFFGVAKYIAKNDFWSDGAKMSLQNVQGEQLASIEEDDSSRQWHHYKIFVGEQLFAHLKDVSTRKWYEYGTLGSSFILDVPGPDDYTIEVVSGWISKHNFIRNGKTVAHTSFPHLIASLFSLFSLSSKKLVMTVEIEPGEEEIAILCTCLAFVKSHEDARRRKHY